jgi:hypothetical protein
MVRRVQVLSRERDQNNTKDLFGIPSAPRGARGARFPRLRENKQESAPLAKCFGVYPFGAAPVGECSVARALPKLHFAERFGTWARPVFFCSIHYVRWTATGLLLDADPVLFPSNSFLSFSLDRSLQQSHSRTMNPTNH